MKLEEEKVFSSSKHPDNRIFLLLVLIVVLLAGLYVVNFREQKTAVKAEFGCPTGEFPVPVKVINGVEQNLCPAAQRSGRFVYTPRNVGALSTTFQCCKSNTVLPTVAAFRNIDNAYCNSQLGVTNAYCSRNQGLSPKCEGTDSSAGLRCGTAKQRVCCIPRAPISRPRPTSTPAPTSIPVPTSAYTSTTCDARIGLYPLMRDQEQALNNKGFCNKNPGYGKYLWNGFYATDDSNKTQAKCYSQFTKLCSTTQRGYAKEASVRCLNNEVAMNNCIASSPVLLADFNSNFLLSCPSGAPKYVKDPNGKCYLEGGQLMTSTLNNKKFCVNKLVDSATPGCQRTPPVCTGGNYAWGGLNPSTGFDTCYRQNAQYNSSVGYCVQKAVPSEYCACKENSSMPVCSTLSANP